MYELGIFLAILAILMRQNEPIIGTMLMASSIAILTITIKNKSNVKRKFNNGVLLDPRELPVLYRTPVWL
jgi:hypothetical protein